MVAYITTNELEARLGTTLYARLTDRVNGTTADAAVATALVDEAEAEVDSFLAARYATPVDLARSPGAAEVLAARTLDVAEYRAWIGSPFVSDVPRRIAMLYAEALRWLRDVARGQIDLPTTAPPASPVSRDDVARVTASPRRFTHDELEGL
jgi:phage gp36-like protein